MPFYNFEDVTNCYNDVLNANMNRWHINEIRKITEKHNLDIIRAFAKYSKHNDIIYKDEVLDTISNLNH